MIANINSGIFISRTNLIELPSSKSQSNRALIIRNLAPVPLNIYNLSASDDTIVLKKALENPQKSLDIGHAGTAFRFLTAYLSMQNGEFILSGSDRIRQRPIKELVDALNHLGADIQYLEKVNYAPLRIDARGPLNGGIIEIDSSISSQFISALLMLAPKMMNGLVIILNGNSVSYSFIELTIDMMRNQGIQILGTKKNIIIKPQEYNHFSINIESDFASASYWFSILTQLPLGTRFVFENFKENSIQPDKVVLKLFSSLGITSEIKENLLIIEHQSAPLIKYLNIDLELAPDLAQTMMVTCAALEIPLKITGLSTLPLKETNRLLAMQTEMKKFGVDVVINSDYSIHQSGKFIPNKNAAVETYKDHRMAMSFASIFIKNKGININEPEVVSKSYPGFWKELEKFANIEFKNS